MDIRDLYYNIKNGIPNLIKWLPIIWKDRDYDDYFLYKMIAYKLKFMGDLHKEKGHAVNSEDTANQLYYAADLARKVCEHDYQLEVEKKIGYTEKYGNNYPGINLDGYEANNEQRVLLRKSYDLANDMVEHDRKELFDYMKEHSREWWD